LEFELGVLLEDELFMSVPCDAGELAVSIVWPLDFVVSGLGLVELPMVPLVLPLTPLPVCEGSTGPMAPLVPAEPLVPAGESAPVEGAAGRA